MSTEAPFAENQYEAERLARIARNKEKMAQLGLINARDTLTRTIATLGNNAYDGWKPRTAKKSRAPKLKKAERAPSIPSRASKRIRGELAPDTNHSITQARLEAAQQQEEQEQENPLLGRTTKGSARKAPIIPPNTSYAPPYTLPSIGTTVWDLGHVHRGAWADRYWSSSGCSYHHAYPVGYRATKQQFGKTYEMRIEEGETGPVFIVRDQASGVTFKGSSPTKPWTEVCIYHRTGQRISGPLYFGFSDPTNQAAIAACLYSPQELEAALSGDRPQAQTLTEVEQAAAAFTRLKGVGEKVGMVLAHTTVLGGVRHSGPESLSQWVRVDEGRNVPLLEEYLLNSGELPEATRRWPAWRARIVPTIIAALKSGVIEEEQIKEQQEQEEDTRDGGKGDDQVVVEVEKEAHACALTMESDESLKENVGDQESTEPC